jgi:methylisocitrate lyase
MNTAAQLRQRLADTTRGAILLPGAFNALTAMAIERAGFEGVYVSGAALSNCVLGLPDVGLTTLTEAVNHARTIARAVRCPVICDADTGFGEAVNVARAVEEFAAAGVAGIHIEDQVLPKRCGHLSGKRLLPPERMCEKIRMAVAARSGTDLVIIVRIDSRDVLGLGDATERAKRYIDAGADVIFPEALTSDEEFVQFAYEMRVPLLANMTEFGKSPLLPAAELERLGYRMIIYPMTLVRVMMKRVTELLDELKREGTQAAWLDRMQTRRELYDLLGYDALKAADAQAAGPREQQP